MTDDARKAGGWWGIVLALILLPVMNVLSIGPVVYVVDRTGYEGDTVRTIYSPVEWLAKNTPLKKPLVWYVGLWEK